VPRRVKFELTNHARKAVAEREIPIGWIEQTVEAPELIVPDPSEDRTLFSTHCISLAPARLDRYLAAVPAMSFAPVAPFLNLAGECCESQ